MLGKSERTSDWAPATCQEVGECPLGGSKKAFAGCHESAFGVVFEHLTVAGSVPCGAAIVMVLELGAIEKYVNVCGESGKHGLEALCESCQSWSAASVKLSDVCGSLQVGHNSG